MITLGATNNATNPRSTGSGLHLRPDTAAAVPPAAPAAHFRDPATHALMRVRPTGRSVWPTLASVLAPLTPRERRYVLGIMSLSPGQQAAAYGTGK
jgi:hypothetical protein